MPRLLVFVWIACAAILGVGCSQAEDPDVDRGAVEAAVRAFYQLLEAYDYDGLRAASSPDFEILEAGLRMDMDDFVSMLQGMESRGVQLSFDLADFDTEVSGDVGYTTYRMVSGGGSAYLEGLILLRTGSGWVADRAFSTRAAEVNP